MVTLPAAHPEWMMRRYLGQFHLPAPLLNGILCYVELVIGHRFEQIAPLNTLRKINCPVLLVHGLAVESYLSQMVEALSHTADIELMLVNDAGHGSVDRIEEHGDRLIQFLVKAGLLPG